MNGILFEMKNVLTLLEGSKNLIVSKTIWCLLFKIVGFISSSTESALQSTSASVFSEFYRGYRTLGLFVVVVFLSTFLFSFSPSPT